ncbi:AsnC family transcriptional regulator [Candidatus Bathyarchaeota archaeon]|nr:AsnC family transcriptional regulator [Candidatus Bathyarchaeota archaeon]
MMLDDVDLRILSELMKNAKMSDREIAKRLEGSQPTITRRRSAPFKTRGSALR